MSKTTRPLLLTVFVILVFMFGFWTAIVISRRAPSEAAIQAPPVTLTSMPLNDPPTVVVQAPTLEPPTPTLQAPYATMTSAVATMTAAVYTVPILFTDTSTATITPTPTDTATPTPSDTPIPSATPIRVVAIPRQILYIRSTANVRACARLDCPRLTQLGAGNSVSATGTIVGDALSNGNTLWYRVDYQGHEAYIHSNLLSSTYIPPTMVPYVPPTPIPYVPPPVYNPPDYDFDFDYDEYVPLSPNAGEFIPYEGNGGGPTRCADGTYSHSSGRGTCSHHGGIA